MHICTMSAAHIQLRAFQNSPPVVILSRFFNARNAYGSDRVVQGGAKARVGALRAVRGAYNSLRGALSEARGRPLGTARARRGVRNRRSFGNGGAPRRPRNWTRSHARVVGTGAGKRAHRESRN